MFSLRSWPTVPFADCWSKLLMASAFMWSAGLWQMQQGFLAKYLSRTKLVEYVCDIYDIHIWHIYICICVLLFFFWGEGCSSSTCCLSSRDQKWCETFSLQVDFISTGIMTPWHSHRISMWLVYLTLLIYPNHQPFIWWNVPFSSHGNPDPWVIYWHRRCHELIEAAKRGELKDLKKKIQSHSTKLVCFTYMKTLKNHAFM